LPDTNLGGGGRAVISAFRHRKTAHFTTESGQFCHNSYITQLYKLSFFSLYFSVYSCTISSGLQADCAIIEKFFVEPSQKARFLASLAPHSGDWLLSLPIANCGLRLDDEAVRVAVGMRLGLSLCVEHTAVHVVSRWMPNVSMPRCVKRRQVESPDTKS